MGHRASAAIAALVFLTTALGAQNPEQTYFEFQVTKPVRQAPGSKSPVYPPELKMAGTQGEVLAQFVVDTLGEPLVTSFKVLRSSHGLFTESVRTALPEMRFVPAEMNGRKVRQLVQQPFVFAIAGKDSATSPTVVARSEAPSDIPSALPRLPLPLTPAPRAGTVDGWWLAQRTTVDSGSGTPVSSFTTRIYGAAGRIRVEMHGTVTTPLGEMIMLLDSAAGRMSLVIPSRKMVTVSSPDIWGALTVRSEPFAVSLTVADVGAGEAIAGVATRHYRVSGSSGVRMTLGDRTCTVERLTDMDVWTTTDAMVIDVEQRILRSTLNLRGATLLGQFGRLEKGSAPDAGMRIVSRSAIMDKNGNATTMTVTSEVTDVAKGPIEAALFDPPGGYQLLDGSTFGSSTRTDSIGRAMVGRAFARMVDSTNVASGEKRNCTTVSKP